MAPANAHDGEPITEINVTPLVDVILVVLIIFMATAPMLQRRAMHVDVPKAEHHERAAVEAISVLFGADGRVLVGGMAMSQDEMARKLARAAALRPDVQVYFAAERELPYKAVVAVLDAIRGAGVRKIGLEVTR